MNNLAWQAGKNLKRSVEGSGRAANLNQWIVALWLVAQEEGISLDEIVIKLIATSDFAPGPIDKERIKRELGF